MPKRTDIKSILIIGVILFPWSVNADDRGDCKDSHTLLDCLGYYKTSEKDMGVTDSRGQMFSKLAFAEERAMACDSIEDTAFFLNAVPVSGIAALDEYMESSLINFALEKNECLINAWSLLTAKAKTSILETLEDFSFDKSDTSALKNRKLRNTAKQLKELPHA